MLGHLSYIFLGINPVGAMLVAIPFGLFEMKYNVLYVVATAPLLNYVQVLVVDVAWDGLSRWDYFKKTLEKKRSARVEKMLNSGGAFWAIYLATPVIGAWVVMAFMRYAQVKHRKVALPILLGLYTFGAVLVAAWLFLPELFNK